MIREIINMISSNQNDVGLFTIIILCLAMIAITCAYIAGKFIDELSGIDLKKRMLISTIITLIMAVCVLSVVFDFNLRYY